MRNPVQQIMQELSEEAHYLHEVAGFLEVRDTGVGAYLVFHFMKSLSHEEILASYPRLKKEDLVWLAGFWKKNRKALEPAMQQWFASDKSAEIPYYT